jgi:hypothetical protein
MTPGSSVTFPAARAGAGIPSTLTGQKSDGSAYDGTGEGRSWPILTGERGHYELAAGRDPLPFIQAMERFASETGLLPEQLWDADHIPEKAMFYGRPSGSAMPLEPRRISLPCAFQPLWSGV